jgi:hypothetical protein
MYKQKKDLDRRGHIDDCFLLNIVVSVTPLPIPPVEQHDLPWQV